MWYNIRMKICWDNLEKIKYRPNRGGWQDKKYKAIFYDYKEKCKNCNEPFLGRREEEFCDKSCAKSGENHPNYGRECSEETIQKMREAHTGKQFSEETIQKMREAQLGEKHHNWKGGISCEPYCDVWLDKEFKESIKERDGYQCLNPVCSKESEILCVHHINYNKKDCRPFNLITLCNSCNVKANSDREWHEAWYNAIIHQRYLNRD